MPELLSYILNAILGGGLIVTVVTIKSIKKKSKEEAKSLEIDNAQKLLDNFDTFIVQPLKSEVNELRNPSTVCKQPSKRSLPALMLMVVLLLTALLNLTSCSTQKQTIKTRSISHRQQFLKGSDTASLE